MGKSLNSAANELSEPGLQPLFYSEARTGPHNSGPFSHVPRWLQRLKETDGVVHNGNRLPSICRQMILGDEIPMDNGPSGAPASCMDINPGRLKAGLGACR